MLSGEIISNAAKLALQRLNVALATANHLLLLHLQEELLALLLGELVELGLALCFFLLG